MKKRLKSASYTLSYLSDANTSQGALAGNVRLGTVTSFIITLNDGSGIITATCFTSISFEAVSTTPDTILLHFCLFYIYCMT